ncbi:MAG: aminotransferase class V-fold PLP-dependent enzyme, partial [Candidatus Obscuribacter sp.]|nr:aminotransferase class V-fold PLP-dependent enzyme [Candidatus Obscuribacter sp.]
MSSLDISKIRKEFPILRREIDGKRLVYLDNAATSQKPLRVIDSLSNFYSRHNANIHRGIHTLSEESTNLYEGAR